MALSTSIGLPPDTDSILHWVKIISLTRESPARRYSLYCCFTVHLKVKPPLLRTKLKKWSLVNKFAVMASKTVITFHRKIILTEILSTNLLYYTAGVQCSSSGKHFAALSSAFSNQVVAKCQGTRKLQHPIHFVKRFFHGKIQYEENWEKFQTLACNAFQNRSIFRLQILVRKWKL